MNHEGRRYGGLAAHERRETRRRRLLDAALEVFGTAGYASSSIEGLCARAGVSPRHFYEHFTSREELLVALYDELMGDVMAHVLAAGEGQPLDVESRARAGLTAFIEAMLSDERKARVQLVEVVGVSERLEQHRRGVLRAFSARIESDTRELIAAGAIPDAGDPQLSSILLVGATNELLVDWVYRKDRPSVGAVIAETVRLFRAAAAGPPA